MKKIPTLFLFYVCDFWIFQTGLRLHRVIVLFLFLSFSLPTSLYAQLQSRDSEKIERLIDEGNFKEVIHYINTLDSLQAPGSIAQAHSRLLSTPMSGAAISHTFAGHHITEIIPSLLLLALTLISWYFRPADRKTIVNQ